MLKSSVDSFGVVTLDHSAREKVVLLPWTLNHALTRRLGIPKTNSQIRNRLVISGEMFERPRQRKQSRTRKTQPYQIATNEVTALDRASHLLGRLKKLVDGFEILDRSRRFLMVWDE